MDYKGVYGLGEKFDAVNQKGKTVETQVIEKFCNQGNISYCVTPFFVTDSGLGIYIKTKKTTTITLDHAIRCQISGPGWPLLMLNDKNKMTLTLALNSLNGQYGTEYNILMAGSLLSMIPIVAIYALAQKYFKEGLMAGGVKG